MATEYIPEEVRKLKSYNRFNKNFNKNSKEETRMSMNNPFQQAGNSPVPGAQVPGGVVPGVPTPGVPTPGAGSPNVARYRQDSVTAATTKGLQFKPKALITDGEEVERYVYDVENRDLVNFITKWKAENRVVDEETGKSKAKTIHALRAVKELCAETGRHPRDFALVDENGNRVTEIKKPSVKGFIITFPGTETEAETTEIIKKPDLMNAILNRGGFALAGTVFDNQLNTAKLEIPVALVLTPTKRKSKANQGESLSSSIRISGQMHPDRKKQLFPDKNNVGLYDMFRVFPYGEYEVPRIVPLKLYETEDDNGRKVAKLDMNPEKKLAQYVFTENTLDAGSEGAEIMEKLGITATRFEAAFARRAASAVETEADLVAFVSKAYTGVDAGPDVQKYINSIQ